MTPRTIETWLPTKQKLVFNERSQKLAPKMVSYNDGGWLYVRCVLDDVMIDLMEEVYFFTFWRKQKSWLYTFNPVGALLFETPLGTICLPVRVISEGCGSLTPCHVVSSGAAAAAAPPCQ